MEQAAPTPGISAALEAAALAEGTMLLDEHKANIEATAATLVPELVSTIVNAVNAKLTDGGLNGLVEGRIKAADVAAEGTIDAAAEAALATLLDDIDTSAKSAVARLTAT